MADGIGGYVDTMRSFALRANIQLNTQRARVEWDTQRKINSMTTAMGGEPVADDGGVLCR
jgi:hypothetical protein